MANRREAKPCRSSRGFNAQKLHIYQPCCAGRVAAGPADIFSYYFFFFQENSGRSGRRLGGRQGATGCKFEGTGHQEGALGLTCASQEKPERKPECALERSGPPVPPQALQIDVAETRQALAGTAEA